MVYFIGVLQVKKQTTLCDIAITKHMEDTVGERTAAKILQSGIWWPNIFNDCKSYVSTCPECNITGNISK